MTSCSRLPALRGTLSALSVAALTACGQSDPTPGDETSAPQAGSAVDIARAARAWANKTYAFTSIEYPEATATAVRAGNDSGQLVGTASMADASTVGFVYRNGSFTALPVLPDGLGGDFAGINDAGVIVGSAFPRDLSSSAGFILKAGMYEMFSKPGWAFTFARGINDAGFVTGFAMSNDASGEMEDSIAFIYAPASKTFTDIDLADAKLVVAQGIDERGQVVGAGQRRVGGAQGFVRSRTGEITLFQLGGQSTRPRGINDSGLMVGFYTDASTDRDRGFVALAGDAARYQTLDAASTGDTYPQWITNAGRISGMFIDDGGIMRGFVATRAIDDEPGMLVVE